MGAKKNFEDAKNKVAELKELCVKKRVSMVTAVMNDEADIKYALVGFEAAAVPAMILSLANKFCELTGEDTEKFLKNLISVNKDATRKKNAE